MNPRIIKIVGVDDWLVFGEALDGRYYYTIVELFGTWLDTPHNGQAKFGSPEWAEDWRQIVEYVRDNAFEMSWAPVTEQPFHPEKLNTFGMDDLDTRRDTPVWSAFVAEHDTRNKQADATRRWEEEHQADPPSTMWQKLKRALQS